MINPPNPDVHRSALANRLRELRATHWPGRPVRQQELATALGVGKSTVSNWERRGNPIAPGPARLAAIATFFATRRSVDGAVPRLHTDTLAPEEKIEQERLLGELTALRVVAAGLIPAPAAWDPWRFPDDAPIRIICGSRPEPDQPESDRMEHHDFVELNRYADLDAMVELYGHLRAENPRSDVQHRLVADLGADDLRSHLVVLGHLPLEQDNHGVLGDVDLPVRRVDEGGRRRGFELRSAEESDPFLPTFSTDNPRHPLTEDVGFFFRRPSPVDDTLTMTFCSGVFTRGVYGAVQILLDRTVREVNATWMSNRFGGSGAYGVLVRVPVRGRYVITPNLTDQRVVLESFGPE
jgi:transcriptional regulator with XRE-family HTH domain